jgi:RNA polymerase sigma factor (sigma-70 family)
MKHEVVNMVGRVIGYLTVVERARRRGCGAWWLCRCTCGQMTERLGVTLRKMQKKGIVSSCGCKDPFGWGVWRFKNGGPARLEQRINRQRHFEKVTEALSPLTERLREHTVMAEEFDPEETLLLLEAGRRACVCIATLSDRQREVLRRRFWDDETLDEIGQDWGVVRERVRQIEAGAINRLRKMFFLCEAAAPTEFYRCLGCKREPEDRKSAIIHADHHSHCVVRFQKVDGPARIRDVLVYGYDAYYRAVEKIRHLQHPTLRTITGVPGKFFDEKTRRVYSIDIEARYVP